MCVILISSHFFRYVENLLLGRSTSTALEETNELENVNDSREGFRNFREKTAKIPNGIKTQRLSVRIQGLQTKKNKVHSKKIVQ